MNRKNTKHALLMSGLALLLCVSMLVGSTYAWFTDSVTSTGNIIKSGTLDVTMHYADGTEAVPAIDSADWADAASGAIFNYDKWEPGYVEVRHIKIANVGTLALKYQLFIEANGTVSDLEKVIDVYYADPAVKVEGRAMTELTRLGTLEEVLAGMATSASGNLEANTNHTVTLALKMRESAGNDYQDKSIGTDFSVKLFATQLAYENDSFDNRYDAGATYPANISVFTSVADKVNNANEINQQFTITHQDDSSSVSKVEVVVPQGTKLEDDVTEVVLKIVEKENVDAAVVTQITSQQTATTYEISIEGVADDNNADIEFTLIIEKGLVDVKLYHEGTLIDSNYNPVTGEITFTTNGFSPFTVVSATKLFAQGSGTQSDPYIINEAEDLLNISKYYHAYKYYKVADGVKELDLTGIGRIDLNGSFDGNGVTMNNLTTALFQRVGKSGVAQDIKISNLTANVNVTDGSALVKNIYNCGETTFENVTLHGYIEGQYNMGSFYNYGTANAGDGDGADYTVNFVNTKSDATLVCTTGNAIGGMLGHGFEGADYKLSINMDANSGYTGDMYTTGTATCYKVMAMCSHATYVLNGTEVSRYNDTYPSTRLTKIAPTAGTDGYYVTPAAGVDHYVVYLNSQLTAYDANGNKIANKAGMTWNLGKETIASGLDGKVFDLITSANIVNDTANDLGYAMNNGELTIYSGRSDNYASGWVTLQVNQYDANGVLLATGITTVHTFVEP